MKFRATFFSATLSLFLFLLLLTALATPLHAQRKRKEIQQDDDTKPVKKGSVSVPPDLKIPKGSKLQTAIALYESGNYKDAEKAFADVIEKLDDDKEEFAKLMQAKNFIELGSISSARANLSVLEGTATSPDVKAQAKFDIGVANARDKAYLFATKNFIDLIPAAWQPADTANAIAGKSFAYLKLLALLYLTESDLQGLYTPLTNAHLKASLLSIRLHKKLVRNAPPDEIINEASAFQTANATLTGDAFNQVGIAKSMALQKKNPGSRRLRVGILAPVEFKPFAASLLGGQTLLALGMIQNVQQYNRTSTQGVLEMAIRNSKDEPTESISKLAAALVEKDSVDIILGPMFSNEALQVSTYCLSKNVPMLTPTATDENISKFSPVSFQINPTHNMRGQVAGRYAAKDMSSKTAIVFVQDSTYSRDMGEGFKKAFEAEGGTIKLFGLLPRQKVRTIAKAITPLELKFDRRNGYPETRVDIIYAPLVSTEGASILLEQLKYYNMRGQLIGSSDWIDVVFLKRSYELANGFIYASDFEYPESNPIAMRAQLDLAESWRAETDFLFWRGYDAVEYLIQAVMPKLPQGKSKLIELMKNAPPVQTIQGSLYFNGGQVNQDMTIMKYTNGTFMKIK
jgi:branched-chain amino acid transport system substrate-binding protein